MLFTIASVTVPGFGIRGKIKLIQLLGPDLWVLPPRGPVPRAGSSVPETARTPQSRGPSGSSVGGLEWVRGLQSGLPVPFQEKQVEDAGGAPGPPKGSRGAALVGNWQSPSCPAPGLQGLWAAEGIHFSDTKSWVKPRGLGRDFQPQVLWHSHF